ncbi:MAG: DNA-processing protein DprA [Thermostichales cyanobacterium DRC_bins_46]
MERAYWGAWLGIPGIGCHRLKRIAQHFGSLQRAWQATAEELQGVEGIGEQLAATIVQARRQRDPEQMLASLEKPGIPFLTPGDREYPQLLWEIPDPPGILYWQGEQLRWEQGVAMVGTRHPSEYGRRWGLKLAKALAEAGLTVVSGLAVGIDRVCHEGALQGGGVTLAVLGTGVDRVYPAEHRGLAQQIRQQGALVSEYAPGTPPAKENFPRRNRIIAGLCRATVVIEAPAKSGALITAYLANDYNRDVYALPGSLDQPGAYGCLGLVERGASLILGVEDLLAKLGVPGQETQTANPPALPSSWSDLERRIWQHLGRDPVAIDTLAEITGAEIQVLTTTLLMMELAGWVQQHPGMRYGRSQPI